jgi:hypothetical protein
MEDTLDQISQDTIQTDNDDIKTIQVDTETLIKKSIGILIIIIIIVLLYYIISTIITYNKRHDLIEVISSDRNAIFLNKSLYNQAIDSKNISNEYLKKYTIANNQNGYFNYNLIANPLDSRKTFQTPDGNMYLNINKT